MDNTILSRKDLSFLELIIARHGYLVSVSELKKLFNDLSDADLHQRIKMLVKRGWLIRIKQGYYSVANLESHNFSNISPLVVSRIFVPVSYISFEYALHYDGFFDQMPNMVTAVTSQKSKRYFFQGTTYYFVKAKPNMMTGYREISVDGKEVWIADLEKALLDFLYFRKDAYTIDLVLEKIRETRDVINSGKLNEYAALYSISTKRRLGYLMDICHLDSDSLHKQVLKAAGYAKLTKDSKQFNAKWRIYYENRFTE
jgi:predicted transcriptional regulator of viral defense system